MFDGERGVRALESIKSGQFVCEFEGNLLTKGECEEAEKEYKRAGKAVYILEGACPYGRIPVLSDQCLLTLRSVHTLAPLTYAQYITKTSHFPQRQGAGLDLP